MKKKSGSSLVYVLLLASVIMLVSTVAMTSVSMNVKMRNEENKRIQSLYGADSGLEFAFELLVKTYNSAIEYANKKVEKEFESILNTDNELNAHTEEIINQKFNTYFDEFIKTDESGAMYNTAKNAFTVSITESKYANTKESNAGLDIEYSKEYVTVKYNTEDKKPPALEATVLPVTLNEGENNYKIKVYSTFESVESGISNERQVSVEFEVETPDYKGKYVTQFIDIHRVFNDKVLAADKDLYFNNNGYAEISGKVFVVGDDFETTNGELCANENSAYDKYCGGIQFKDAKVEFNDEVVTSKTININGDAYQTICNFEDTDCANIQFNANIYARNLYVGNYLGSITPTSYVSIKNEAIIDNDLAVKAKDTEIKINEYYGINEKTFSKLFSDSDNQFETVDRTSSSIIVNGNENTKLEILDKAYILGVAYINTTGDEKYQTGESVAIKGNYAAYSYPLPDSSEYSNAEFKYVEPLYLVDKVNGQSLTIDNKAEYFLEYYSNKELGTEFTGGVTLPDNTYSAGAIVSKNDDSIFVEKGTYDTNANNIVEKKRENFAEKVYAMGSINGLPFESRDLYHSLGYGSYMDNEISKSYQMSVSNTVDFNQVSLNCQYNASYVDNDCNQQNLKLIPRLNDSIKPTVVMGSNANTYVGSEYVKFNMEPEELNNEYGPKIEAVIIVDGDVIIDGSVDFTGNIIATGDVIVKGNVNSKQRLTYNENSTNKIIARCYGLLNGIFTDVSLDTLAVDIFEADSDFGYDVNKYIKTKNWNILK